MKKWEIKKIMLFYLFFVMIIQLLIVPDYFRISGDTRRSEMLDIQDTSG